MGVHCERALTIPMGCGVHCERALTIPLGMRQGRRAFMPACACARLLLHTHGNPDKRTAVVVRGRLGRKLSRGSGVATKGATSKARSVWRRRRQRGCRIADTCTHRCTVWCYLSSSSRRGWYRILLYWDSERTSSRIAQASRRMRLRLNAS